MKDNIWKELFGFAAVILAVFIGLSLFLWVPVHRYGETKEKRWPVDAALASPGLWLHVEQTNGTWRITEVVNNGMEVTSVSNLSWSVTAK